MAYHLNYQFIEKLKALPFVDEIWLFGSRARGDHQDRSDIDIVVLCDNATEENWVKVMDIVEDADTLLKIDCIRWDVQSMSEALRQNILKDKQVIYVKKQH